MCFLRTLESPQDLPQPLGVLHGVAEGVDVETIANEVGTPVYIYSKATFLDHLKKIQTAYAEIDTTICYSIKACGNINILKHLAQAGSGFDIVSGGELYRALQAGADPSKIVYAGVGKTDTEIVEALQAGIGYFNIESEQELDNLIEREELTCIYHGGRFLIARPDIYRMETELQRRFEAGATAEIK